MYEKREITFIEESKTIPMEEYSELFYGFSKEITQGCIIPIIPEFKIKLDDRTATKPFALLIIENACNLVKSKGRSPKVSQVEFILIYDANDFLKVLTKKTAIRNIIQNRYFKSDTIYLPPNEMYKDYQKGFIGYCNYSDYINLITLKIKKQEKYICVKPPYRDYIKNKYIYFKLSIPLFTITDNEALIWIDEQHIKKE